MNIETIRSSFDLTFRNRDASSMLLRHGRHHQDVPAKSHHLSVRLIDFSARVISNILFHRCSWHRVHLLPPGVLRHDTSILLVQGGT